MTLNFYNVIGIEWSIFGWKNLGKCLVICQILQFSPHQSFPLYSISVHSKYKLLNYVHALPYIIRMMDVYGVDKSINHTVHDIAQLQ